MDVATDIRNSPRQYQPVKFSETLQNVISSMGKTFTNRRGLQKLSSIVVTIIDFAIVVFEDKIPQPFLDLKGNLKSFVSFSKAVKIIENGKKWFCPEGKVSIEEKNSFPSKSNVFIKISKRISSTIGSICSTIKFLDEADVIKLGKYASKNITLPVFGISFLLCLDLVKDVQTIFSASLGIWASYHDLNHLKKKEVELIDKKGYIAKELDRLKTNFESYEKAFKTIEKRTAYVKKCILDPKGKEEGILESLFQIRGIKQSIDSLLQESLKNESQGQAGFTHVEIVALSDATIRIQKKIRRLIEQPEAINLKKMIIEEFRGLPEQQQDKGVSKLLGLEPQSLRNSRTLSTSFDRDDDDLLRSDLGDPIFSGEAAQAAIHKKLTDEQSGEDIDDEQIEVEEAVKKIDTLLKQKFHFTNQKVEEFKSQKEKSESLAQQVKFNLWLTFATLQKQHCIAIAIMQNSKRTLQAISDQYVEKMTKEKKKIEKIDQEKSAIQWLFLERIAKIALAIFNIALTSFGVTGLIKKGIGLLFMLGTYSFGLYKFYRTSKNQEDDQVLNPESGEDLAYA